MQRRAILLAFYWLALYFSPRWPKAIASDVVNEDDEKHGENDDLRLIMAAKVGQLLSMFQNYYGRNSIINQNLLSVNCYEDLLNMKDTNGMEHVTYSPTAIWQKHMLDSYGTIQAGILEGNIAWLGDFTQCNKVQVWKLNGSNSRHSPFTDHGPDFKGKYCLPKMTHYLNGIFSNESTATMATFAICIPSTCTSSEVEILVNQITYPIQVKITDEECVTDDPQTIDQWTAYALIPFAILGVLVLCGTIWDIIKRLLQADDGGDMKRVINANGTLKSIVLSFSAYTNTKNLLNTSHRNETLCSINGLRAMSMFCVIIGHTLLMSIKSIGQHNQLTIVEYLHQLSMQPIINASYTVVTFFCITGFLVTQTVMERAIRTRRFPIIRFYVHRIWRLVNSHQRWITPTLLLVTLSATGPLLLAFPRSSWNRFALSHHRQCRENLWMIPLYIEVYFDKRTMCMSHTWYLNIEMALYMMSPIILYPIIKKHWTGPVIWIGAILASSAAVALLTHRNNLDSIISPYTSLQHYKDYRQMIYKKPWGRAQPFLIGMFFGFIHYYKGKDLKLSKAVVTILWLFTAVAIVGCLLINYPYAARLTGPPSHAYKVSYMTLHMAIWSAAIGWIILACATGYGGVVNSILSWKCFVPIGRLSFCAFIVHVHVLLIFNANLKQGQYLDRYLLAYWSIAINIAVLFVAWVLCLVVEAPSNQLEKLFSIHVQYR